MSAVVFSEFLASDEEAIASRLKSIENPADAMKSASDALRDVYWNAKDIDACKRIARVAIDWGTSRAKSCADPEQAREVLGRVKEITYNLGSFLWAGWDEPGIALCEDDIAIGSDAAALNLKLVIELGRNALARSRVHWLVGAYELSRRKHGDARSTFQNAAALAIEAGERPDELLCESYAALTEVLENPTDASARDAYEECLRGFDRVEGGADFVAQLHTAERVFLHRPCGR